MSLDLTNSAALQAVGCLTAAQAQLEASQSRVASGLKIGSAKDDGALWQIAENIRAESAGWTTVAASLARGQSILDVASGAAQQIVDLMKQIEAKAVAYAGANDAASRAAYQNDIQAAVAQVDSIARGSDFNGINLLNQVTDLGGTVTLNPPAPVYQSFSLGYFQDWWPGLPNETGTFDFTFAGGPGDPYGVNVTNWTQGTNQFQGTLTPPPTSTVSFPGTQVDPNTEILVQTFPGTTLTSASFTPTAVAPPISVLSDPSGAVQALSGFDLTSAGLGLASLSWGSGTSLIAQVEAARQAVVAAAANLGSQQQLVTTEQTQANQRVDVLTTGVGNLVNADLAKESASLQAAQVKRNLAAQALSIANAQPRALLALYR
jgi:flagellin